MAIVSTWVAGEIGFIREGLADVTLSEPVDGFDIFIETIPYRFYVLWALAFVPIVAIVLGVTVLNETLEAIALAGVVLVLAGAWIASRAES